ncbi:MAG: DUF4910 domain-containing protein [Patescibacteria group bacterium]
MWRSFFARFAGSLHGRRAARQAAELNRLERFFTFPRFEQSADYCREELARAGLAEARTEVFPADGRTAWSGWRAMQAWDVDSAVLAMVHPERRILADWSITPETLVMYSGSCACEGELVEWNGETPAPPAGKIPFTRRRIMDVLPEMRALGIKGIVSDFLGTLPGVRDAFDLPDAVRWENFAFKPYPGEHWGFMLTPRQGAMLREMLAQGPVRLRAEVRTRLYDGVMKSATAHIPGADPDAGEVLLISHLFEPGANDNASGAGLALEIARGLNAAIEGGTIPRPRRGIRFLLGWEGFGLLAWVHAHRESIPRFLGGINIDEIGVNQAEGRSVLHLFMPPAAGESCVGYLAEHLCREILSPALRWKSVADRAEIINDAVTADPNIGIPLPTLIQYPARHYHASSDRPDTLDADVMEAVGNLCATHLYFLADAGPREARYLAAVAAAACRERLFRTELRLLGGSWPFGLERTKRWFNLRFGILCASLRRFGLPEPECAALAEELAAQVEAWCERRRMSFPREAPRRAARSDLEAASSLVLSRATLGMTMPPEIRLPPAEARAFLSALYGNELDLVFFRLAYWADGRRSLLEIVDLLELELDEIQPDAAIARTGSGSLLSGRMALELNLGAVLHVAEVAMGCGCLKARRA